MTDAPAAPRYALMNALAFDRLPRAQLDELLAEVQARPPFDGYFVASLGIPNPTNGVKARALRHAQATWLQIKKDLRALEARRSPAIKDNAKPQPPARTRTQGGSNKMTHGAVALAIFAAIPACPVWGADPCTCALCTPTEVPNA